MKGNYRARCLAFDWVLLFAIVLIVSPLNARAEVINFSGQLGYITSNTGGAVYSGSSIGPNFIGSIDDATANGSISDGTKVTSFGCCIAAGGLSVSNNSVLNATDTTLLNSLIGSSMFSQGDLIDSINIEGDVTTAGGGRIEIGLSYVFDRATFADASPGNYPFDQNNILVSLYFIAEFDSLGKEIYHAVGKLSSIGSSPYSFGIKNFEITGNLSQNAIDEFNDGVIAPWTVQDPTAQEGNGIVTLKSPGALYNGQFNDFIITQERSAIDLTPASGAPFFVRNGNGDYQATSRWVSTLPGLNQSFGMTLDQEEADGGEFTISFGNSGPDVAGVFGGGPSGLGIGFSVIKNIDLNQAQYQAVSINPADITGDILLRLSFDDANNRVTASYSLDGVNFQSPFNPYSSSVAGVPNPTINWELHVDMFDVQLKLVDTDRDGIANKFDADDDNDGLSDAEERTQGRNPLVNEAAIITIVNSILLGSD